MKQGDFVYENWYGDGAGIENKWGVILETVDFKDFRRAEQKDVFRVLWQDGSVGKMWDYDLTIMEAS